MQVVWPLVNLIQYRQMSCDHFGRILPEIIFRNSPNGLISISSPRARRRVLTIAIEIGDCGLQFGARVPVNRIGSGKTMYEFPTKKTKPDTFVPMTNFFVLSPGHSL